jgi:hypothetical protein
MEQSGRKRSGRESVERENCSDKPKALPSTAVSCAHKKMEGGGRVRLQFKPGPGTMCSRSCSAPLRDSKLKETTDE